MSEAFLGNNAKKCALLVQLERAPPRVALICCCRSWGKELFQQTKGDPTKNHNISMIIGYLSVCTFIKAFLHLTSFSLMKHSIFSKMDIWEMLLERSIAQIVFAVRHIL